MHFLKEGQKIRAWVDPPPHSGNARKKTLFSIDVFPNYIQPLDTALVTGRAQIGWAKGLMEWIVIKDTMPILKSCQIFVDT